MTGADVPRQPEHRVTVLVYGLVFVAFLDNFAMLPTVAPYAEALAAGPVGTGVAVAAYSVTNLVFNAVGGHLLDRRGRRRVAVAGLAAVAAALLLYPLVSTLSGLVTVRLLHGAAGGVLLPAVFTLAADNAVPGTYGRTMGRVGALIGAAAVAGPMVAGVARQVGGFTLVFVAVAAVAALGAITVAAGVPETHRAARTSAPQAPLGKLLAQPEARLAGVAVLGLTFGLGTLAAFLPGSVHGLGHGPATVGAAFTLLSLVAAVLMLGRGAARVDRGGVRHPAQVGLVLLAAALLVLVAGRTLAAVLGAVVLFGAGFGVLFPAVAGAVAALAPAAGRGRAFGLFSVVYSVGFIVGPPSAGWLHQATGSPPYLASLVVAVACLAATFVPQGAAATDTAPRSVGAGLPRSRSLPRR